MAWGRGDRPDARHDQKTRAAITSARKGFRPFQIVFGDPPAHRAAVTDNDIQASANPTVIPTDSGRKAHHIPLRASSRNRAKTAVSAGARTGAGGTLAAYRGRGLRYPRAVWRAKVRFEGAWVVGLVIARLALELSAHMGTAVRQVGARTSGGRRRPPQDWAEAGCGVGVGVRPDRPLAPTLAPAPSTSSPRHARLVSGPCRSRTRTWR